VTYDPETSSKNGLVTMTAQQQFELFCDEARQLGALDAVVVSPSHQVFTATRVRLRCQYGCSEYGWCLTCPPHSEDARREVAHRQEPSRYSSPTPRCAYMPMDSRQPRRLAAY
jgi:hypothetical protein